MDAVEVVEIVTLVVSLLPVLFYGFNKKTAVDTDEQLNVIHGPGFDLDHSSSSFTGIDC